MLVGPVASPFFGSVMNVKSGSGWLQGLIDFVYPPLCLGCGDYTENDSGICESCWAAIDTYSFPFCLSCMDFIPSGYKCPVCKGESLPLYAYGDYADPLEQIIIQFKFKGITRSSQVFAGLLTDRFGADILSLGAEALVYVPLHARREMYRGYNQAEVFARDLSAGLGLEVCTDVLRRARKRRPQARLSLSKREINIKGVFEIDRPPENLSRVILVDDVVTSGSTVREAIRTLEEANIRVLAVIALAHAR